MGNCKNCSKIIRKQWISHIYLFLSCCSRDIFLKNKWEHLGDKTTEAKILGRSWRLTTPQVNPWSAEVMVQRHGALFKAKSTDKSTWPAQEPQKSECQGPFTLGKFNMWATAQLTEARDCGVVGPLAPSAAWLLGTLCCGSCSPSYLPGIRVQIWWKELWWRDHCHLGPEFHCLSLVCPKTETLAKGTTKQLS